ncbi:hypothetical protein BV22DRAFT_573329 [Leucogyrophana mollusca]|uniref:Uncharacterized protein n=1 Tax=Leucogyrophana mollusca TaxID=85980 RepID=A0ACB8BE62_9AGAM|nr:hypothetical protein BV22DRAFT_573329 [Leucogyrophana mollusca]
MRKWPSTYIRFRDVLGNLLKTSTSRVDESLARSIMMNYSSTAFVQLLIPGFIGFMISLAMYGIALGQYVHYWRTFPHDRRRVKYFVGVLVAVDTLHVYCSAAFEWSLLVPCRHNGSTACFIGLPWQSIISLFISFLVPFSVQSFYGQRIWIISGKNKVITGAIFFLAAAQIVLGSAVVVLGYRHTPLALSTPIMLAALVAAVAADIIISGSVYFYLRPGRFGIKRTETRIRHLTIVSINMGFLTCAIGIIAVVFLGIPQLGFAVSAAAMIIVKSHINSVLAVLNARKPKRQGGQPDPFSTIQLPPLSTIQLAEMSAGARDRTSQALQERTTRTSAIS